MKPIKDQVSSLRSQDILFNSSCRKKEFQDISHELKTNVFQKRLYVTRLTTNFAVFDKNREKMKHFSLSLTLFPYMISLTVTSIGHIT